jgi:hypothetical protein
MRLGTITIIATMRWPIIELPPRRMPLLVVAYVGLGTVVPVVFGMAFVAVTGGPAIGCVMAIVGIPGHAVHTFEVTVKSVGTTGRV